MCVHSTISCTSHSLLIPLSPLSVPILSYVQPLFFFYFGYFSSFSLPFFVPFISLTYTTYLPISPSLSFPLNGESHRSSHCFIIFFFLLFFSWSLPISHTVLKRMCVCKSAVK